VIHANLVYRFTHEEYEPADLYEVVIEWDSLNRRIYMFDESAYPGSLLSLSSGYTLLPAKEHDDCARGQGPGVFFLSLNFSQFVEGRRWWSWAREGLKEAYVFAGDAPYTGEETYRASTRF
jgi:hypothetical protein